MWLSFTFRKCAFTAYKNDLCLFPAGDCFCQSAGVCSPGVKIRNRLPGDCHCTISKQCRRVHFCQTTNQYVKKKKLSMQNISTRKTTQITKCLLLFFTSSTGSLPGVSSLRLVQAGFFSLSVGWDQPSSPVQGYRLTYGPRGQQRTYLHLPPV